MPSLMFQFALIPQTRRAVAQRVAPPTARGLLLLSNNEWG
jgi:hypothetical protein